MILVYVDHDRGALDEPSLQALTFAKKLDGDVHAFVAGADGEAVAASLGEYGVSVAHVATHDGMKDYTPQAAARALAELAKSTSPKAVLATSGARGNEVLAHAAAMLDEPFAAECVEIALGAPANVTRSRWGGNMLEEARIHCSNVLVATVPPFTVVAEAAPTSCTVDKFTPSLTDADTAVKVVDRVAGTATGVSLAEAKIIVSGGRGVGAAENWGPLEDLAGLLNAALGCSRVVTSNGWRPHSEQVGQTGTKVAPDLYIASGISGATQHIAGCKKSKTILAINTDPEAPIMAHADYAVIGDLHEVLPAIASAIRSR
mgnify:FL=1